MAVAYPENPTRMRRVVKMCDMVFKHPIECVRAAVMDGAARVGTSPCICDAAARCD